ncbi:MULTISPECIES: hypothetical protein [unclassified Crossiella]|uniref:hypothetical protein n=1 Tax=unclassified Crossiella TaxID=2620835 RepID=UPI001FFF1B60|nr:MULTISPECIES: hypothetical protein [unclassified Crossiella]MCK2243424.1 hypothetical protein [Crossiella sp. S99.2]MCK2257282.1 hypothetical protein [Crossiella sp. S99.1]
MPDFPDRPPRWLPAARIGLVVFLAQIPLLSLVRFELTPAVPGRTGAAAVATLLFLPPACVLLQAATGGRRPRHTGLLLGFVTLVVLGATPVVGVDWLASYYLLITLVLVQLRPPWSLVSAALLAVSLVLLPLAMGHPGHVLFFGIGGPMIGLSAAVLIWLLVAVVRLRDSRAELAAEAVLAERARAGAEITATLGAPLARLAEGATAAARLVGTDSPGAAVRVRELAAVSRQSLAQARRLVSRYRRGPLRAELDTAVALLAAAGIPARLELPAGPLPEPEEAELARLRAELAARLARPDLTECVITVRANGSLSVTG